MPVQLLSILRFCGRGSLRRALVSGDACPDSVIRGCEELLGSKLFPHYGSREMGMAGAITCPAHEGMHLREHAVIAEIIGPDSQVLPHGEVGELVITTIGMEALPLIRYRTGDYTRILPEPCPCGSATIRLDRLQRRESGGIVALDDALFSLEGLVDYRAAWGNGVLNIHALTLQSLDEAQILRQARSVFPRDEIHITCAPAEAASRALYGAKRSLHPAP